METSEREALERQLLFIHSSYVSLIDKLHQVEQLGLFVELAQEQLDSAAMNKEQRVHLLLSTFGKEFSEILYEINSSLSGYREASRKAIQVLESAPLEAHPKGKSRVEEVLDAA